MNRILKGTLMGSIALVMIGCGDAGAAGAGAGGGGAGGGNGGGGGTCQQHYTVADLNGCYEIETQNVLDWYCFDGAGRWREDGYNSASGCVPSVHTGTYELDGCTLKSVRDDGEVGKFAFRKDNQGNIYIGNDRYKWASDLNGYCKIAVEKPSENSARLQSKEEFLVLSEKW